MIADNIWHYFPPNCCLQLSVYICEKPASLAYQDRKQSSYLVLIPYVCNSCNCTSPMFNDLGLSLLACMCFVATSTHRMHCMTCGFLWSQIYDSFKIKNSKCFSCLDCEINLTISNNVKL